MPGIKHPVLIDANVLLNGIFVPLSKSRDVLTRVQRREITAYVLENTMREASAAIKRAHQKTGVDLSRPFDAAMHLLGIMVLPGISQPEAASHQYVKGAGDRAIAAAAKRLGFAICTSDKQDFKNAPEHGIFVQSPEELVEGAARVDDGVVNLQRLMPGMLATHREGTFYAEVRYLNWGDKVFGPDAGEIMYVFDAEGIGSLCFEASTNSFRYQVDYGPTLRMKWGTVSQRQFPLKFVVTYRHDAGVNLYVGYRERHESTSARWVSSVARAAGPLHVGNDRADSNQLNGVIFLLFGLPARITEKAANNIMRGATTLQPWDRLGLEEIIELLYAAELRTHTGWRR